MPLFPLVTSEELCQSFDYVIEITSSYVSNASDILKIYAKYCAFHGGTELETARSSLLKLKTYSIYLCLGVVCVYVYICMCV